VRNIADFFCASVKYSVFLYTLPSPSRSPISFSLFRKLCRKIAAAVVICDVNSKNSIAEAGRWKTALDKKTSFYRAIPSIFVGNKVDLLTDIERGMAIGAEAQRLGTKYGFNRYGTLSELVVVDM